MSFYTLYHNICLSVCSQLHTIRLHIIKIKSLCAFGTLVVGGSVLHGIMRKMIHMMAVVWFLCKKKYRCGRMSPYQRRSRVDTRQSQSPNHARANISCFTHFFTFQTRESYIEHVICLGYIMCMRVCVCVCLGRFVMVSEVGGSATNSRSFVYVASDTYEQSCRDSNTE